MPRRRRYERRPLTAGVSLTPIKKELLRAISRYRIMSLPQIARLSGLSGKAARKHLRVLFDAGLVRVIAVSRSALADGGSANDPSLVFGSAPNIYTLSRTGMACLYAQGLIGEKRPVPDYGPRNSLFLAHELEVRDVRLWLELSARAGDRQRLTAWKDGEAAAIDLKRLQVPRAVRPDAWFVYRLARPDGREGALVGLVELDRGTERGGRRWQEKLAAYGELFAGGRLREATGYANARVLVVAPDARRRDRLAAFIQAHAAGGLAGRFWLADRGALAVFSLAAADWRRPGEPGAHPLVPPDVAARSLDGSTATPEGRDRK